LKVTRGAPSSPVGRKLTPLRPAKAAFLGFAHEAETLTRSEAEGYRARVWSALIEVARRQSEHQREANPVDRFLALLRSAISAGHAHLATRDGTAPANPGAWGWRAAERTRNRRQPALASRGARVGWIDGEDLFLDIDSAYYAAEAMAAGGHGIGQSSVCTKPAG
jgi:hypothetical protein